MANRHFTLIVLNLAISSGLTYSMQTSNQEKRSSAMEKRFGLSRAELWHQLPQELKSKVLSYTAWHALPPEIKLIILSFVSNANSMEKVINNLKNPKLTSKEFYALTQHLLHDPTAMGNLARKYIAENPEAAAQELIRAAHAGKAEVVHALINGGINVNVQDTVNLPFSTGETALMKAARLGHTKIVRMLIDNGADVNFKDARGDTPLKKAVLSASNEIVEILLNSEADPNIKNEFGITILGTAVVKGYVDIVETLLKWGANPKTRNLAGRTALDIARRQHQDEIAKILEQAEAKI